MSVSTSTNPTKATFSLLEGGSAGTTFTVQYNPKEFKVDKKVAWKEVEEQGKSKSPLEFQKGSPRTLTMELYFDNTHMESPTSVYDDWVEKLLAATNVDTSPSGESSSSDKQRPTSVLFEWGGFELTGVVESITTTYVYFSAEGTPLRAKCQVKMKEWEPPAFSAGDTGSQTNISYDGRSDVSGGYQGANTDSRPNKKGSSPKIVTTTAGQTPQDVANEHNTTPQKICEDNGIDNPLYEFGGEDIVVFPGSDGQPADDGFSWGGLVDDVIDAAQSDDPAGNLANVGQENAGAINDELDLF